jgi:hypothetical protein
VLADGVDRAVRDVEDHVERVPGRGGARGLGGKVAVAHAAKAMAKRAATRLSGGSRESLTIQGGNAPAAIEITAKF